MACAFRYPILVLVAFAVSTPGAPVLAEDPPPDYEDPCPYADPLVWPE